MKEVKEKKVFKQKIAGILIAYGHKLIRLEPNREKPELNVFVFKETSSLIENITKANDFINSHKSELVKF